MKSRKYLRARNFDPEAALKQYATSEKWRRKMNIDETYDNVDIESFEALRRLVSEKLPFLESHRKEAF